VVQDAVSEVADDFNAYSRKRKGESGLHQGTGTPSMAGLQDDSSAYNVSLGQRYVLQGSYLVTFRMVDTIMVFYVCDPDVNPLSSFKYVDAAAKILVAISKGVDISHKRLAKKYADLHMLLGRLLSRRARHLPSAFVHAPATNEKLLSMPVSASDANRRLKKVLENKSTKNTFVRTTSADDEGADEEGRVSTAPEESVAGEELLRQAYDASGHDVRLVEFKIPAEALPPPPSRVIGATRVPPAPPLLSAAMAEGAFSGALSSSDDHSSDTEGIQESENLAIVEEPPPDVEGEAPFQKDILRQRRHDLQQAIVMVEVWKGTVKGSALSSVSVHGEIKRALAPYNVDHVMFRVRPSGSLAVDACLGVASVHKSFAKKLPSSKMDSSQSGMFMASLSGIPIDATYLKYVLPSATVNPPLQAKLLATTSKLKKVDNGRRSLLVCIPYAVDPGSSGLVDVSVTVSFPPEVTGLLKTSHKAEWCPIQSKIRWEISELAAGKRGVIRAMVLYKNTTGTGREELLTSNLKATVFFSGYPGKSYSGLRFDMSGVAGVDGASIDDDDDRIDGSATLFAGNIRTFGQLELFV
jgi:hypothetical protein